MKKDCSECEYFDEFHTSRVCHDCKPWGASAEAVQIHNDGTLEVKVPNAHKVGRVLVMDTDSHIGGGLFYPDDAVEVVRCKDCEHSRVYGKTTQWLACESVMEGQATDPDGYCYLGERKEP